MALLDRIGAFWPSTNGKGRPVFPAVVTMRAPQAETKGLTFSGAFFSPDGTRTIYRLDGSASSEAESVTSETAYAAALYAYAAMRYRAEKYSEPALYVAELSDDDEEEWLPDHPLAELLDTPSPDYDMGELLRLTRLYRDVTGSALWLKEPSRGGGIARLTPFSGDEFDVESADGRIFGRFRVRLRGERTEPFPPERVVYFRETNPADWKHGLAPLDVALGMLNLGQRANATVRGILRNALFPSVIIQPDVTWQPSDDEWSELVERLEAHARSDQQGRPLLITGGGTATKVSLTLKDLMPDEVLDRVEACVSAAFGIPPVVLGFLAGLKNSPWSQMAEARRMTYEDTIEPMWARDQKTLTRQLLLAPVEPRRQPLEPDTMRVVRFDTTTIRALQADRKAQSDMMAQWAGARIASRNELRAVVGLEPRPEPEEDELPPFQAPAPVLPGAPPQDPPKAATKARIGDEREVRWMLHDAVVSGQEFFWQIVTGDQLAKDRGRILELAKSTLQPAKAAGGSREVKAPPPPPPFGADPDSVRELIRKLEEALDPAAWLESVTPLVEGTGRRAVQQVASEVGVAFDVLQPGLLEYVERHAAALVKEIDATTRSDIASTLRAGLELGESVDDLTKRIEESGAFAPSRAELIARTEVTTVTNNAGRDSLSTWSKEAGRKTEKSWLSARDDRVRPEHRALDNDTWLPIDSKFANGLQAPGEPNCRCTTIYRVVEE